MARSLLQTIKKNQARSDLSILKNYHNLNQIKQ